MQQKRLIEVKKLMKINSRREMSVKGKKETIREIYIKEQPSIFERCRKKEEKERGKDL